MRAPRTPKVRCSVSIRVTPSAALWALLSALAGFLSPACHHNSEQDSAEGLATGPAVFSGRVVDEAGAPLAAARVEIFGGAAATTDAQGTYTLSAAGAAGAAVALRYSASGHATVSRALIPRAGPVAVPDISLRPVDLLQSVVLPSAQQPAASLVVQKQDGAASLTLPPASLVGPDGRAADGAAEVSLTYWYPHDLGSAVPGRLNALTPAGDLEQLTSYGMADIEVRQGDSLLQVAPGATVKLSFTVSADQRTALAQRTDALLPELYWLDPSVGLWTATSQVGNGNLIYDRAAGVFSADLTHMSAWNMDAALRPDFGGCVTGQVINSCDGRALSGQPVSLWILGQEQLAAQEAVSGANGRWCMNVGLGAESATTFQYFLSGRTMADTQQCNPLPSACRSCEAGVDLFAGQQACNTCKNTTLANAPQFIKDAYSRDPSTTRAFYGNNNACQPPSPTTTLQPCSFCGGNAPSGCSLSRPVTQNCQELTKLMVPGPGCVCANPGGRCTPTSSCCLGADGSPSICSGAGFCVSCADAHGAGDTCSPGDVCCNKSNPEQSLVCSDGFCVDAANPI